ncbi:hypothetical protein HWI79_2675 [Cryptosporidium felis]|nr:hypothetical protein HWI79_2675 [Cryptosporidium felis]
MTGVFSIFPPKPWSNVISRTNGRSLNALKYLCCCTSNIVKALNRAIGLWSGCLLSLNILILLFCIKTSLKCPVILKWLFPRLVEHLTSELSVIYILLYVTSIFGIVTGFVGVITTSAYSIIALKICMVCNYLNILKDFLFLIIIVALLFRWNLGFFQAITFFLTLYCIIISIGIFCSFVLENLLYHLELGNEDESSTAQNTEAESESTNSRNLKNDENNSSKDLESAKDDESRNLIH